MDYKSFLLILFLLKPEVNGFGEDFKRKDIQKADMRFAASKTSSTSPDDIHFYAFTKNQYKIIIIGNNLIHRKQRLFPKKIV